MLKLNITKKHLYICTTAKVKNINNPFLLYLAVSIERDLFFIIMNELIRDFNNREAQKDYLASIENPYFKNNYDSNGVTQPKQYQIGIDTFQRAESNLSKEEILAICKFNIDKYCWRKKDQDKEDFKKIIDYANWAIKNL